MGRVARSSLLAKRWLFVGASFCLCKGNLSKKKEHRRMSFSPFSFDSVTVPFLSLGRESSFSFKTFTGLPCAWPEEEYWVFLENFLRATTLGCLPLWTQIFPSNADCSSQVIFSQIYLAIQYISILKAFIGKHENK